GFLNGPVCPVYGFGMLALLACLHLIMDSVGAGSARVEDAGGLVIFLGAMVLASTVELIAGRMLDVLFHARWWDYRMRPFNLNGYICLQFSILWGLGGVFVIKLVHPTLEALSTDRIPEKYGWFLLAFFYAVYLADLIVTVMEVRGMNRYLKELDEIQARMHIFSDAMSETIGSGALKTQNVIAEGRVQGALARAELRERAAGAREEILDRARETREELGGKAAAAADQARRAGELGRESYRKAVEQRRRIMEKILKPRFFGARRLLEAFPDLRHRDYDEYIALLRITLERNDSSAGDPYPEESSPEERENTEHL
ncbi:MAG: putative ABC transporter permease, partial [bacterium]